MRATRCLCVSAIALLLAARLFAGGSIPTPPPELAPQAAAVKKQFEKGDYAGAEQAYRKLLESAPNNVYLLSNLGVVLFRESKFDLAEETIDKALAVDEKDAFSQFMMGIVKYTKGKYDEAEKALDKAIELEPKNAIAHNYLGITASQQGRQGAALNELKAAITLDPNYADAHFNLAVVLATLNPPEREIARKHYERALELGAERDAAMESLIKGREKGGGAPKSESPRGYEVVPLSAGAIDERGRTEGSKSSVTCLR